MKLRLIRVLSVSALLLLACSLLSAQETKKSAVVTVEVHDQAGSPVTNAQTKFVPIQSTHARILATDALGSVLLELEPGNYDLIVTMPGFRTLKRRINVSADENQKFNLVLEIQPCEPCVEVSSEPLRPAKDEKSQNEHTKSFESTIRCTDKPYARDLPPPGQACEKELFARRGRPFMFPARDGIAFGVSSSPDEPSELYLWADNQTGQAVDLIYCCISTLFDHIDMFDSEGHRVLSKTDQAAQKALSEGRQLVQVCTCSGWSSVPPHTVQLFVFADISDGYTLKSGRYTISERSPYATYAPPGLAISVP